MTVCYTMHKGSVKVLHDAFWFILELQYQVAVVPGIHLMSTLWLTQLQTEQYFVTSHLL